MSARRRQTGRPRTAERAPSLQAPWDLVEWAQEYRMTIVAPERVDLARPLLIDALIRGEYGGQKEDARKTARAFYFLADWFITIPGAVFDLEHMLTTTVIDQFAHIFRRRNPYRWSESTRTQYISSLRRLARRVNGSRRRSGDLGGGVARQYKIGFSDEQLHYYWAIGDGHRSELLGRAIKAAIAFGAGAGAGPEWLPWILAEDVFKKGQTTYLRFFEPDRVIPVDKRWGRQALELAESAGDDYVMGGRSFYREHGPQMLWRALSSYRSSGERKANSIPDLNMRRLKWTWYRYQLERVDNPVRVPELLWAAGVTDAAALNDLLIDIPLLDPEQRARMLRG